MGVPGLKISQLFPNFEALKCKFSKNLWFQANVGPWGTEQLWNGGLGEWPEGREKGVFKAARNRIAFSGEYPTQVTYLN